MAALAKRDFPSLTTFIGPDEGVCLRASKGAPCVQMPAGQLAKCGAATKRWKWSVDDGSDQTTTLTCRQAFDEVFLARSGLEGAEPSFNCFAEREDNNDASIVFNADDIYVEFHVPVSEEPPAGWRSLWLVWSKSGTSFRLDQIVSHYWGI